MIANSWDDWVPQDRVRKFTDENKELAAQLHTQMKILQTKAPKSLSKKGGRTNGSDFSSARGSEERNASAAAPSVRGPRRNRDYDLEHVSLGFSLCFGSYLAMFGVPIFGCWISGQQSRPKKNTHGFRPQQIPASTLTSGL